MEKTNEEGKEQEYSIGYKKPPKHSRFKPGQSGNPTGRPKKERTMSELFLKALRTRVSITTAAGTKRKIRMDEAIAKQFAAKAAGGDHKALRLVLDQINAGRPASGDKLANLIQEFRTINARHEASGSDESSD